MSTIQRRNSQRLASALEALSSDLDVVATETEVTTEEDMKSRADEYLKQDVQGRDYDSLEYLGDQAEDFNAAVEQIQSASCDVPQDQVCAQEQDQEVQQQIQDQDQEVQQQIQDQDQEVQQQIQDQDQGQKQASIEQGDPGVDDFGSQSTKDCNDVVSLGKGYGVDFNGDEDLQPSIRQVPGRAQKQAKIKKLIARIQNVANHLEKTGRKKLAYRLDVVCNNLEKKYSIK